MSILLRKGVIKITAKNTKQTSQKLTAPKSKQSTQKQSVVTKQEIDEQTINMMTQAYSLMFEKMKRDGIMLDGGLDSKFKNTMSQYTRENVTSYLTDPSKYEKELRNVSNYLMQIDLHYWRTVNYMSTMAMIVPIVSPANLFALGQNDEQLRQSYYEAIDYLKYMNLQHEFGKVINKIFVEDVFYGIECEETDSYYIKRLNPDYCRISSVVDGVYNFEFDMSYFDKDKKLTDQLLEGYSAIYSEFKKFYSDYQKDKKSNQWVQLDPTRTICIKLQESLEYCFPPFVSSFSDIMNIGDYKALNKFSEQMENYKMLGLEIPINQKGTKVDDFLIDPMTAQMFYGMIEQNLPSGVGAVLSPMPIKEISFNKNRSSETNSVAKATKAFYDTVGVPNVLFSEATTAGALKYSTKVDEMLLIGSGGVYRQLERWINRKFKDKFSGEFVVSLLDVTVFNYEEVRDNLLKLSQYGLPTKIATATLCGMSQLQVSTMSYLENNILNLSENWIPLSSSHTASGTTSTDEGGRPTSDDTELTESGETTRDNDSNANKE